MTKKQRRQLVNDLLRELAWYRTAEAGNRFADKDKNATGIIGDFMLSCVDFAEKQNIPLVKLLRNVALAAAAERGFQEDEAPGLNKAWRALDAIVDDISDL